MSALLLTAQKRQFFNFCILFSLNVVSYGSAIACFLYPFFIILVAFLLVIFNSLYLWLCSYLKVCLSFCLSSFAWLIFLLYPFLEFIHSLPCHKFIKFIHLYFYCVFAFAARIEKHQVE